MQIEYALNAVAAGATSLGIKALDGVVLATEKKLASALIDEATVSKISLLTEHVGAVYSGMGPDARVLVTKARKAGETYYRTYHETVPAAQLVRETATVMQEFTQSGCAPDAPRPIARPDRRDNPRERELSVAGTRVEGCAALALAPSAHAHPGTGISTRACFVGREH